MLKITIYITTKLFTNFIEFFFSNQQKFEIRNSNIESQYTTNKHDYHD